MERLVLTNFSIEEEVSSVEAVKILNKKYGTKVLGINKEAYWGNGHRDPNMKAVYSLVSNSIWEEFIEVRRQIAKALNFESNSGGWIHAECERHIANKDGEIAKQLKRVKFLLKHYSKGKKFEELNLLLHDLRVRRDALDQMDGMKQGDMSKLPAGYLELMRYSDVFMLNGLVYKNRFRKEATVRDINNTVVIFGNQIYLNVSDFRKSKIVKLIKKNLPKSKLIW